MLGKTVLIIISVSSLFAYSDYAVIVDKINNDYESKPKWTEWTNVGVEFDCVDHSPLISEIEKGTSFIQTFNCQQKQERKSFEETETKNTTIAHTETLIGTYLPKTCLDVLNDGNTVSGNYLINPTGNEDFTAYCDMTTDGGGWTLVFYSNSNIVNRSGISGSDWNTGPSINFSRMYSFKDIKRDGVYEFFVHDSSTVFRHAIFNQTNSYLENPVNNNYTQTGGNFYYSSIASGWKGLALGSYGAASMSEGCTLAMANYGSSWWYCLQDQTTGYGTGPWFNAESGADIGAQQFVKVYQR